MYRFRELLKELGLTQEELITKFNARFNKLYSAGAMSQFENGKRTPETESLICFAEFYDVTIDYLLGRSPHRNISPYQVNADEYEIILKFRRLDNKGKDALCAALDVLAGPSIQEMAM